MLNSSPLLVALLVRIRDVFFDEEGDQLEMSLPPLSCPFLFDHPSSCPRWYEWHVRSSRVIIFWRLVAVFLPFPPTKSPPLFHLVVLRDLGL